VSSPVDTGRELEEMMAQILQNSYPPAAGKNNFNFLTPFKGALALGLRLRIFPLREQTYAESVTWTVNFFC
jgi:hypothetical protein